MAIWATSLKFLSIKIFLASSSPGETAQYISVLLQRLREGKDWELVIYPTKYTAEEASLKSENKPSINIHFTTKKIRAVYKYMHDV